MTFQVISLQLVVDSLNILSKTLNAIKANGAKESPAKLIMGSFAKLKRSVIPNGVCSIMSWHIY